MKDQVKNGRLSDLHKGKVKRIGLLESIPLRLAGRSDGRRGLPREIGDGRWTSPYIEKEVRSYNEYVSRMFGELQVEEESEFARLTTLMDSILRTKFQLDEAAADLNAANAREGGGDRSRRPGENKLTDDQVAARRANEKGKRLSPAKSRVSSLEAKLASEIDAFSALRAKLIESNNSVRMVCNRVRDHLYERLSVYWNAALRKHPEKNKLPVVPYADVIFLAEEIFLEPHRGLMQDAEALIEALSATAAKEAE